MTALSSKGLSWLTVGLLSGVVSCSQAEQIPLGNVQKSLWDEAALHGSPSDKILLKGHHGGCIESQPDCRVGPEMPGEIRLLLPETPVLPGSIRSVVPRDGQKLIALTFDLCELAGERAAYDADIVNYLRQQGIKATFYAGGKWMRSHPEKTMQLMSDPLFEIGNHGWRHRNLRHVQGAEAEQEVLWTQAQYVALRKQLEEKARGLGLAIPNLPPVPVSYRFPFGTCSPENLHLLEKFNLSAVQWSIVTGDPSPTQSAKAIAEVVLSQAKPGAIIIAHANGKGWHTAEALPLFIPQLQQQGYHFVTIAELLHSASKIDSSPLCYEMKPGDNARYDHLGR